MADENQIDTSPQRQLYEELLKIPAEDMTGEQAQLAYRLGVQFGEIGPRKVGVPEAVGVGLASGFLTEGGLEAAGAGAGAMGAGALTPFAMTPEQEEAARQSRESMQSRIEQAKIQQPGAELISEIGGQGIQGELIGRIPYLRRTPGEGFVPFAKNLGKQSAFGAGIAAVNAAGKGADLQETLSSAETGAEIGAGLETGLAAIPKAVGVGGYLLKKSAGLIKPTIKGPDWASFEEITNPATMERLYGKGGEKTNIENVRDKVLNETGKVELDVEDAKLATQKAKEEYNAAKQLHKEMIKGQTYEEKFASKVKEAINDLSKQVGEEKQESLKLLSGPDVKGKRIVVEPLIKHLQKIRSTLPIQKELNPVAKEVDNSLSRWENFLNKIGGDMSMKDSIKLIDDLDEVIDYKLPQMGATPRETQAFKELRFNLRQTIGEQVPEYNELVSKSLQPKVELLNELKNKFRNETAVRTRLKTINNPENIDLKNRLNELDAYTNGKLSDRIEEMAAVEKIRKSPTAMQDIFQGLPEYKNLTARQQELEAAKQVYKPIRGITPASAEGLIKDIGSGKSMYAAETGKYLSDLTGEDIVQMSKDAILKQNLDQPLTFGTDKTGLLRILSPEGIRDVAKYYGGAKAFINAAKPIIAKLAPSAKMVVLNQLIKNIDNVEISNTQKALLKTEVNKLGGVTEEIKMPPQPSPTPQRSPQSMAPSLDDVTNFIQNRKKEDF